MNIAFDTKRFFYNATGLGEYSRNLVYAYADVFPTDTLYLLRYPSGGQLHKLRNGHKNIKLVDLDYRWQRSIGAGLWEKLNKTDVTLYHGLSNELPYGIQSQKHIKSVVTIHDLFPFTRPRDYSVFDSLIQRRKLAYAIQAADGIICFNQEVKGQLIKKFQQDEDSITVMDQFVSNVYYEVPKAKEDTYDYLVFYGRNRRKQWLKIEEFIKKNEQLKFVVIGKYNASFSNTTTVKDVDNASLAKLYAQSKAILYPSLDEGFGLPIQQALAVGRPVYTSAKLAKRFEHPLVIAWDGLHYMEHPSVLTRLQDTRLTVLEQLHGLYERIGVLT